MSKSVAIIYRVDASDTSNSGVVQKMKGQSDAFNSLGWEVDDYHLSKNSLVRNDIKVDTLSHSKTKLTLFEFYRAILNNIDFKKYGLLYIRYGLAFPSYLDFLKRAKEENPSIKIIVELATYPYDDEWRGVKGFLVKTVDKYYRTMQKRWVDHIVHLGSEERVFGINTILSENGISVSKNEISQQNSNSEGINLLAVGKWRFWHGLDRLIAGLAEDKELAGSNMVMLHVVGEGEAIVLLRQLVRKLQLDSLVKFYGNLRGQALEELYQVADVGIGTLGMHRKKVKIDSSLKHRHYAERGIGFILSTIDRDFPETCGFVKYFPVTDEAVDVSALVFFAKELKAYDKAKIRDHTIQNLSWEIKIKRILDAAEI